MNKPVSPAAAIRGEEHWTSKGKDVRLFLWNKHAGDPSGPAGRILFVHGSSMASQASRATISGWRCANKAARSAPEEMP